MKKRHWLRQLAIMATAVTTLLSFAIPASAAAATLPDTTSPRSLTIYKYDNVDDSVPYGEGLMDEVNTTVHRPMKNVIFDVYYYADLDSNVPKQISEQEAQSWAASHSTAQKATIVTDSTGKATWNAATGKSADGVYLVMERASRAIQYTGKTMPFFVSMPYTNPNEDGWVYDVVVQPKNELVPGPEVNKDVTEIDQKHDSARKDEPLTWIIRGDVPGDLYYTSAVNNGVVEFYADKYEFTDEIDSRLDYAGFVKMTIASREGSEEFDIHDEGYTVSGTAKEGSAGGTLIVSLESKGMKEIMAHADDVSNYEIRAYFKTSINDSGCTGDEIPNDVTLDYVNSTGLSYDPVTVPEDKIPEVHTGGFKLVKVDVADNSNKLEGAEFHIAVSEEDALAGTFYKDYAGEEISVTTDANGEAGYTGIPFDNQSTDPDGGTYYYLVETRAPEGFQLSSKPIRITVNADTYRDTTVPYEVPNATKYDLPRAGGEGMTRYLLAGLGVMGIAAIAIGSTVVIHTGKKKKTV